ncbi:MAG TPA: VWA domain-containing protein [Candidatus Baltobacteraceae bacterium]|jgi:Ca-activated chloride channel family protein|nr:VWA domain-containing protein [Candidatus Baltobacteraceae bacterium]
MTFEHPWRLLTVLAVCAIFVWLLRRLESRRRAGQLRYSNLPFLVTAVQGRAWPVRALSAAWVLAVAVALFALAGPRVRASVPVRDGSVVLCVDTSGSMNATDVQPTRADAALQAMRAFIGATPDGTAVGIVSFAGDAQAIVRPTSDRDQALEALSQIPAPNGATAIGDALGLAQRLLPKRGHRIVVLVTDGENNAGTDPMQAAQSLASAGIRLYTVGIGTNTGALIPGTLQEAGIDEEALRAYAAATGGAYSRAGDAVQLRGALAQLGRSTLFSRRTVDVSLAAALCGAAVMILTFLAGIAAGRYP